MGLILSHVDDFTIAGNTEFVKRIVTGIKERFQCQKWKKITSDLQD